MLEKNTFTPTLADLLRRAAQRADDIMSARLDGAMTPRQSAVLRALAAVPDGETVNQIALVRTTGIDRSTMASMLDRMCAAGLVARKIDPQDKRGRLVKLTAKGRRWIVVAEEAAETASAVIMERAPLKHCVAFLSTLRAIAADEAGDDA